MAVDVTRHTGSMSFGSMDISLIVFLLSMFACDLASLDVV